MISSSEKQIDVSVLIVTYNSADDIENCISGIYEYTKNATVEVIVLDNCSRDNTVEVVKEKFPQVNLQIPTENLGFARGVNEAAKTAKGRYILLLNPDTQIFSNAIGNIVTFADSRPRYGLYGARTLKPDRSLQPISCLGLPTLWSMAMFATGLSAIFKNSTIFDPESLGSWKRDSEREVGSIVGCFLLCRKDHWETLNGFDERFYMYGEDVDLAIRSNQLGYPSVICPDSELVHEFGNSADTPLHKLVMLYRGKITLANKHWSGLPQFTARTFIKAGILLRAGPSILKKIVNRKHNESAYHELWKQRQQWASGYPLN